MADLAIKGHSTRGKEVIEILEMLGGKNVVNYNGSYTRDFYFLDTTNIICHGYGTGKLVGMDSYTLEEFLEKYPYKVGDKVILDQDPCIITSAIWDSTYNEIIYYVKGNEFHIMANVNSLQPFKEEIMKEDKNNKSENINNKSEDISEDLFDKVCKTTFGDISYKANEQACDTYNKIKNSKFRNDKIFQMALALAPTFAKAGLDLQQRLLNNGCDVSSCTVGDKDILHAYGESLKLWATAFVDELNNNTK